MKICAIASGRPFCYRSGMSKKDFTQIALNVVQQATGEKAKPEPTAKQESGRKGGLKGGKTRMAQMTDEEKRELALKAAGARWNKNAPDSKSGARKG